MPLGAQDKIPPPNPFEEIEKNPPAQGEDNFFYNFMQMLTSLGIIIVLLFLISYFFRRMMNARMIQMNTSSSIKIVDRRSISPKTAIYLIEVEKKNIILAESSNGVILLDSHEGSTK